MKKLRLNVDALKVQSFPSQRVPSMRGTVMANWSYADTSCGDTVWQAGCSFVTAPLECNVTAADYPGCGEM